MIFTTVIFRTMIKVLSASLKMKDLTKPRHTAPQKLPCSCLSKPYANCWKTIFIKVVLNHQLREDWNWLYDGFLREASYLSSIVCKTVPPFPPQDFSSWLPFSLWPCWRLAIWNKILSWGKSIYCVVVAQLIFFIFYY